MGNVSWGLEVALFVVYPSPKSGAVSERASGAGKDQAQILDSASRSRFWVVFRLRFLPLVSILLGFWFALVLRIL